MKPLLAILKKVKNNSAAVIVEASKKGDFTREELHRLQASIGINHSMLEDPALFLSLGLSPFWLWVPRFIAAIIAVHCLKLYHRFKAASGAPPFGGISCLIFYYKSEFNKLQTFCSSAICPLFSVICFL